MLSLRPRLHKHAPMSIALIVLMFALRLPTHLPASVVASPPSDLGPAKVARLLDDCPPLDDFELHHAKTISRCYETISRFPTKTVRAGLLLYLGRSIDPKASWSASGQRLFRQYKALALYRFLFNVPVKNVKVPLGGIYMPGLETLPSSAALTTLPWVFNGSSPHFACPVFAGGPITSLPDQMREFDYCASHYTRRKPPK